MGSTTKDSRAEVTAGQQPPPQRKEVPVAPHTVSRPK